MKKILGFLLVSLLLTACETTEKPDGYVVNGTAKGVLNGIRVYLKSRDDKGKEMFKDTAIIVDEKFKFEGKIENPQMWFLQVNSVPGSKPFMIENGVINIQVEKDSMHATKVSGTKSNKAFEEYNLKVKELSQKRRTLSMNHRQAERGTDSAKTKLIKEDLDKLTNEMMSYPFEFINKNNDNFFSLVLIESLLGGNNTDLDKLSNAFNNLESDIKQSIYGMRVNTRIITKKQEKERLANLEIGKAAPEFSAPDPDGKMLALKDMRGKVTIIDFWASWCGPCRRENPNVVKVYEKYHDKGLEIIGVSLDKQGQKDRWLSAIEKDKLTWHHVSNLAYFNDPVAKQYAINSIPATYILDEEGTIIAKNLRGPALENKIAELLD